MVAALGSRVCYKVLSRAEQQWRQVSDFKCTKFSCAARFARGALHLPQAGYSVAIFTCWAAPRERRSACLLRIWLATLQLRRRPRCGKALLLFSFFQFGIASRLTLSQNGYGALTESRRCLELADRSWHAISRRAYEFFYFFYKKPWNLEWVFSGLGSFEGCKGQQDPKTFEI